jgi:hypothetical protein
VQLAAFVGALASVALVWRIAGIGSGEERIASVLLVGYAVASLLAAALSLVMLASGANLRAIFGFLLGGLDGVDLEGELIDAEMALLLVRAMAGDAVVLEELLVLRMQTDLRGFFSREGQGGKKDREQELHEMTGSEGGLG